jgi:hypothetical protein
MAAKNRAAALHSLPYMNNFLRAWKTKSSIICPLSLKGTMIAKEHQ